MQLNYYVLGQRIQKIRKNKRISQAVLSTMIDKSAGYISYLECGTKVMSLETFVGIANALEVSTDTLLNRQLTGATEMSNAEAQKIIVVATVEGDIHDIGKNIVSLMLGNHGFKVVDLGKDVKAEAIVEAAVAHKADLIGLSALMTTTMVRMRDTVDLVKQRGLGVDVMVGGAVVTPAFAESIGANYSSDAVDAVRLAKSLIAARKNQ